MAKASDNKFPKVIITEGSAPSNADVGDKKLYIDSADHHVKTINSSGTVVDLEAVASGNVATDVIWDAKGDLVVGTGANAAERLAVGSAGQILVPDSSVSGGIKWVSKIRPLDNVAVGSGDLFGGTSLDGGWSSLQSTAVTSADRSIDGFLVLRNSGNTTGQDRGLKRAFAPAGDFSVSCKLCNTNNTDDFQWAGLFVGAADPSDGASGHRLDLFMARVTTPNKWKYAKYDAGGETSLFIETAPIPSGMPAFPCWLRIRRAGTTLYAGISNDGVEFQEHATTTTIAFTVETIGLFIAEATATTNLKTVFEYIVTTG